MKWSVGQRGFTYLGTLFIVAFMGIVLSAVGGLWSVERQRAKEAELIFIGHEFRDAIGRYYNRSPGSVKKYPISLKDLIKDERQLQVVRHLRRIYIDPMTLTKEWGTVLAPDGGIMGVFSLSEMQPIKIAGFDETDESFEKSRRYSDWKFNYVAVIVQREPVPKNSTGG